MNHEKELRRLWQRVRRRWMVTESSAAIARAGTGAALVIFAGLVAERLFSPAGVSLLLLAVITALSAVLLAGWMLWPVRRMPPDRRVARYIEERCPEFEDRLASAADVGAVPPSLFRELMIADAAGRTRGFDVARIIPRSRTRKNLLAALTAAAALLLAIALAVPAGERALQTAALYAFPDRIAIEVAPGDARVALGERFLITARVAGLSAYVPVLTIESGGESRTLTMQPSANGFEAEISAVRNSFTYRVTAATASSPEYTVTALDAPRVVRIDVEYEYPSFTGLAPRVDVDGGDIYAPAGTEVRLRVLTDRRVDTAAMTMADGRRIDLSAADDPEAADADVLEAGLTITEDGSYRVALGADGMTNPGDTEYFIRMMEDRPPEVRIVRPASDRQVTALEEVTVEARAEDDYGVERFELVYAIRGGEEKVVSLGGESATSRTATHILHLEALDLEPGDFVTYYARAGDVGRGRRSTEARSDIFFLEVRPFEEEFVSAQSQAMAGGGDQGLDDLAAGQKDIIIATWKLDRRSVGGRSAEDIRAVARAQAELRSRAEEAAARLAPRAPRGRGAARSAPVLPVSTEPSALSRAADAMVQAEESLRAANTADALPHEMEALNQLLKAQADVRQRQVTRQQAQAGGGGPMRPQQDLSSLFDRELQRQQQTNYETRTSAETRDRSAESDAFEKIRELARRQDELNREQNELARQQAGLSLEELKRQLERLTREQSELRRDAEELSRELARLQQERQQGQQQQPQQEGEQQQQARAEGSEGQGGQGGQQVRGGGQQMREIVEEMRGATSDLRREDLNEARQRSGRAAEALRDLEAQLRRSLPDERRRAVGEMQLEAQQLAEAQRRIAAEARRIDESGTAADTLRRLAGEKERLADRVDRLEESIEQAAEAGDQDGRAALGEAAEELQRQQVARRMRAGADRMRSAGEPDRGDQSLARFGEAEQDLAQALDRVSRQLRAAGSQADRETRRLSDQLAQARELRDRLADIERRIDQLAGVGEPDGLRPDDPPVGRQPGEPSDGQERRGSDQGGAQDPSGSHVGATGDLRGAAQGLEGELARLRAEYDRELRQAERLMEGLRREHHQGPGGYGITPEGQEYVLSAPGTEAFKQDYSSWDVLRQGVNLTLDGIEAALSEKLFEREIRDRLNAGADQRTPEEYRRLVEQYYRSLAATAPVRR